MEVSGPLLISDPCYEGLAGDGVYCVENPAPGTWNMEYTGRQLIAWHKDAQYPHFWDNPVKDNHGNTFGLYVDSGQMAICDESRWREGGEDVWYDMICENTGSGFDFGYGVASSTYCGDGEYPLFLETNAMGEVESIVIDFDWTDESVCPECGSPL